MAKEKDLEVIDGFAKVSYSNPKTESVVFRVFDGLKMVHYASSRLSSVKLDKTSFSTEIKEDLIGKKYEAKSLPDLKIIAEGKLVALKKTAKNDAQ